MDADQKARSAAAAAIPGTIVLGDRTFVCKPPTNQDHLAHRNELRKRIQARMLLPLEAVNRRVSEAEKRGQPLSPTVVKYLVSEALSSDAAGDKSEPTDGQIVEESLKPSSARWFSWWIIRAADPSITLADIEAQTPTDGDAFSLGNQIAELAACRELAKNSSTPAIG